jgi:hypothetical protein
MLWPVCLVGVTALLAHGPDSTVVPLELDRVGRPAVQVMLAGRGPYRLAVETGSPRVLLLGAVVRALGLPLTPAGGVDSTYSLDSLRIGDMVVRNLEAGRSEAFSPLGVDGVLGLDAFADLLLTVDYAAARLTLSRGRLPEPDGKEVFRAVRVGPFVGIELDLGGTRDTGVVDTQGGILFQVLPEVANGLEFAEPLRVAGRAVVGGNAAVEVRVAPLAGDLRIGRHVFRRPRIAVHPLPADIPSRITIGARALRHFTLTLDQRSMAVRLTRPDTAPIVDG